MNDFADYLWSMERDHKLGGRERELMAKSDQGYRLELFKSFISHLSNKTMSTKLAHNRIKYRLKH